AVPARVIDKEGRLSAEPKRGRVKWRLAVVDLDREGSVISERKQPVEQPQGAAQNAAPAYILDKEGRVIAELKQPVEQPHEEEPLHTPQPQAVQNAAPAYVLDQTGRLIAELQQPEPARPAGAGPLLDQTLHERMARAVRSVLEELRQRNAQAPQPV